MLWVIFLAETSKDLEIILITTLLSFTNGLSRTSFDFSLKTSFVYLNLFSLAKTVTGGRMKGGKKRRRKEDRGIGKVTTPA